jgi:plastocyanin
LYFFEEPIYLFQEETLITIFRYMSRQMNQHRVILVLIVIGVTVGIVSMGLAAGQQQDSYVKHFTVKAFRYGFEPDRLVVNQGDIVIITIEAMDAIHGFHIEDYEVRQDFITPASPEIVSFVADKVGMFRIHCSTICGSLHPFMMAQLEVQPNLRFIGGIIVVSGLTVSFIAYVWMRKED